MSTPPTIAQYDWSTTLSNVAELNLDGNIIPHSWYNHICFPSGKPDLVGMLILAEIVYWYRPKIIKCESTGRVLGQAKRFSGDMLQRTLQSFSDHFGITKRQVQDALSRLKKLGVVETRLRTVKTKAVAMGNVLFVAPIPEKLQQIQSSIPLIRSNVLGYTVHETQVNTNDSPSSFDETYKVVRSNVGGHTFERMTYTENNTKINTDSSKQDNPSQEPQGAESSQPKFAATADSFIADSLTKAQRLIITNRIADLLKEKQGSKEHLFLGLDTEQATEVVCYAMLDNSQFKQCGNNFLHKLNSLMQQVIKGNFASLFASVKHNTAAQGAIPSELSQLQDEIKALKYQRHSQLQSLNSPLGKNANFKQAVELSVNNIDKQIAELQANFSKPRKNEPQGADSQHLPTPSPKVSAVSLCGSPLHHSRSAK